MQKNWGRTSLNEAKPASQKVVLISNSLVEISLMNIQIYSGKGRFSQVHMVQRDAFQRGDQGSAGGQGACIAGGT